MNAGIEQLGINQIPNLKEKISEPVSCKCWYDFLTNLNVWLVLLCGTRKGKAGEGGLFAGTDVDFERVPNFGCHDSNDIVTSGWDILSTKKLSYGTLKGAPFEYDDLPSYGGSQSSK